jgi:hypothetical protein
MELRREIVPVQLANGVTMRVEATLLGGEEDVAFNILSFQEVSDAIESIASTFTTTLEKVKPKKASVEFGLEVAVESGKLTTLLVKGASTANLKITLEWGE